MLGHDNYHWLMQTGLNPETRFRLNQHRRISVKDYCRPGVLSCTLVEFYRRYGKAGCHLQGITTDMRRLTTGIRSEKCVVRRFLRCAYVYTNPESTVYPTTHLGYMVQPIAPRLQTYTACYVLNTVGNYNSMVKY